jgi:hypothetical protein
MPGIVVGKENSADIEIHYDDLKLAAVEGGPHNIGWTHPDEVNAALLEFVSG